MRLRATMSGAILVVCFGTLLGAGSTTAASQSVTLCHVPPENPSNDHEIVVSESAMESHLRKHPDDQVGTCQARCEAIAACDDANACTIDTCNADGTCDNSQPVDCADGNVCSIDGCDPNTGCVNFPVPDANQLACDDGNACSVGDVCVAGSCVGTAITECCVSDADCPASDACTVRYCDDASSACQEVDLSSRCTAGACEVAFCDPVDGCDTTPVTCSDDGDICTVAQCNPQICGNAGGCETLPNPNPPEPGQESTCDDGLDNDCDGLADLGDPDCAPCDEDMTLVLNGVDWAGTRDLEETFVACVLELQDDPSSNCNDDNNSTFICDDTILLGGCSQCIFVGDGCSICKRTLQRTAQVVSACLHDFQSCTRP